MHVSWKYKFLCYGNRAEQTIGDPLLDGRDIMFLTGCPNLLWCNCSSIWWCIQSNISHNYDDLYQKFTKGFVWWTIMHQNQSTLNRTVSMVISRSQYRPLTTAIFSSPKICGNILNIFWGGIKKTPKLLYKINWDTWSCLVLLETVVCGRLCLVLGLWFHRRQGSWNVA